MMTVHELLPPVFSTTLFDFQVFCAAFPLAPAESSLDWLPFLSAALALMQRHDSLYFNTTLNFLNVLPRGQCAALLEKQRIYLIHLHPCISNAALPIQAHMQIKHIVADAAYQLRRQYRLPGVLGRSAGCRIEACSEVQQLLIELGVYEAYTELFASILQVLPLMFLTAAIYDAMIALRA